MRRLVAAAASALISLGLFAGNDNIATAIDSIVANCLPPGTDVAVMVQDLTTGQDVYAHRENVLCRPASITKILSSYTAMSVLGLDYEFRTMACVTGKIGPTGVLDGDLYLVGGFDPELRETDLRSLVNDLKALGINHIKGNVYADVSAMDTVYWGSGWVWDDAPSNFQPYISPLMVHGGYVGVSVKPTSKGRAPQVNVYPENNFIKVVNRAVTQDPSRGPLTIDRDWMHNDNTIVVSGNCTRSQGTDISVYTSGSFTFSLFLEYLDDAGISYGGSGWAQRPEHTDTLATVGHSLKKVMREALKESENRNAEALLLASSWRGVNGGVSFESASKYASNYLKRKTGNAVRPFNLVDGSGLSTYDYIPASLFVDVLRLIYSDPEMYSLFYSSLPINGMDGTMRGRLGTKPMLRRIHAKTGSITGASSLAGYATGSDGHVYAFCIMNEGCIKLSASRRFQDSVCLAICGL